MTLDSCIWHFGRMGRATSPDSQCGRITWWTERPRRQRTSLLSGVRLGRRAARLLALLTWSLEIRGKPWATQQRSAGYCPAGTVPALRRSWLARKDAGNGPVRVRGRAAPARQGKRAEEGTHRVRGDAAQPAADPVRLRRRGWQGTDPGSDPRPWQAVLFVLEGTVLRTEAGMLPRVYVESHLISRKKDETAFGENPIEGIHSSRANATHVQRRHYALAAALHNLWWSHASKPLAGVAFSTHDVNSAIGPDPSALTS